MAKHTAHITASDASTLTYLLLQFFIETIIVIEKLCSFGVAIFKHRLTALASILDKGGIGLSHKAFGMKELLLGKALQVAEDCPCPYGCPSCVGPVGEIGEDGKRTAIRLLKELTK